MVCEAEMEVWRGSVNSWECDQMGHLSARYYNALVRQGLVAVAARLGLAGAFRADAGETLIVTEQHLRFLREARLSAPLHMTAGVLSASDDSMVVQFLLRHSRSGDLAATMRTTVVLADAATGAPRPLPGAVRREAATLTITVPEKAEPRSVLLDPVETMAAPAAADRLGLMCASRGAFGVESCDVFGRLRLEGFLAAVTDGMPLVGPTLRGDLASYLDMPAERIGGAMIEYRLLYHRYPRAGDRFELRSGLAGFDARTMRIVHWLMDPETGQPWFSGEGVTVSFDLEARKALSIPAEAQTAMQEIVAPGLRL